MQLTIIVKTNKQIKKNNTNKKICVYIDLSKHKNSENHALKVKLLRKYFKIFNMIIFTLFWFTTYMSYHHHHDLTAAIHRRNVVNEMLYVFKKVD